MYGDSDIPHMMADYGVQVTIGAVTLAKGGLYDSHTAEQLGVEAAGADPGVAIETVLLQRGVFPELDHGVLVVLNGAGIEGGPVVSYTVQRIDPEQHSLVRVYLERMV